MDSARVRFCTFRTHAIARLFASGVVIMRGVRLDTGQITDTLENRA
jgi:hypothetical protein